MIVFQEKLIDRANNRVKIDLRSNSLKKEQFLEAGKRS